MRLGLCGVQGDGGFELLLQIRASLQEGGECGRCGEGDAEVDMGLLLRG